MKKFGLIGHPIARSLSPGLFKAAYNGKYPYELIQGEDFDASYQRFMDEFAGINVTAPFKELAYAKADIRHFFNKIKKNGGIISFPTTNLNIWLRLNPIISDVLIILFLMLLVYLFLRASVVVNP